MSAEDIFLIVWSVLWLVVVPFTPARVFLATPPGRWAAGRMEALSRVFNRFFTWSFTWLTGRVLAVSRWRP